MASVQPLSLSLFVPDYEEFFLQETHSDVSIVIVEEATALDAALAAWAQHGVGGFFQLLQGQGER
jgi:hypothetical protein